MTLSASEMMLVTPESFALPEDDVWTESIMQSNIPPNDDPVSTPLSITSVIGAADEDWSNASGIISDVSASDVSSSTLDADDLSFYVFFYKLTVPTLFGLVTVLGVIGNVLVIYVILSRSDMRRNTVNLLLLNLATSDLTFLVICVPFIAYHYAAENWTIGDFTCKLSQYLVYVTTYVTVYTLVAVAAVRVCKIARVAGSTSGDSEGRSPCCSWFSTCTGSSSRRSWSPSSYYYYGGSGSTCCSWFPTCPSGSCCSRTGRRHVGTVVAVLWAAALLGNIPVIFLYRVKSYVEPDDIFDDEPHYDQQQQQQQVVSGGSVVVVASDPYVYCGMEDQAHGRRVVMAFFALAYVAPLAGIATMYFRLLGHLRRKARESSVSSHDSSGRVRLTVGGGSVSSATGTAAAAAAYAATGSGAPDRRTSHVTRVLVVVVAVFAACWLPLHVHLLVAYCGAQPADRWYEIFRVLAHCLAYSNSCMNPIIYSYVSTDFRRQFADVFTSSARSYCRRSTTSAANGSRNVAAAPVASVLRDDLTPVTPVTPSAARIGSFLRVDDRPSLCPWRKSDSFDVHTSIV